MESLRLRDSSPTISAAIPVRPGDTPFAATPTWQIRDACPVHVSRMRMTTHLFAGMGASPVRAVLRELVRELPAKETA